MAERTSIEDPEPKRVVAGLGAGGLAPSEAPSEPPPDPALEPPGFAELYAAHFAFVWRSLRRLGVPPEALDDAVQDVFMVALRRSAEFRGRSSERTWLFGIAHNVAHEQRRKLRRAAEYEGLDEELTASEPSPLEKLTAAEALRFIDEFLNSLDENLRSVFVMAELEQMSIPEVARALGLNLNTAYSRRRAAKASFSKRVQFYLRRNP